MTARLLRAFPSATLFATLTGCGFSPPSILAVARPGALPAPALAARSAVDNRRLRVNELGRIPVLMYHSVGAPAYGGGPRYDRHGLNIRPDTFRKQLAMMYAAGWYPVNMRDALTGRIDVPAGKTPVVLTFDDARGSQFFIRKGRLDPTCALAILQDFHAVHPDWPLRGTFYVMGRSKWNPVPFYQEGLETMKLRRLVQLGFEVANHSTSHRPMRRMDAKTLAWEMAECVRYVKKRAPGATMDTMALPYGIQPKDRALWEVLMRGQSNGTRYENRCILLAAGVPAYPPAHRKFDAEQIMRVGSEPGYIESWIRRLKPGGAMAPYVSDGDPETVAIPRSAEKDLDRSRLAGVRVAVWEDTPPTRRQANAGESKRKGGPPARRRAE